MVLDNCADIARDRASGERRPRELLCGRAARRRRDDRLAAQAGVVGGSIEDATGNVDEADL